MKTTILMAAAAASALTAFGAIGAKSADTTVIREHHEVQPAAAPQTSTTEQTTTVETRTVTPPRPVVAVSIRHRATRHGVLLHRVVHRHPAVAPSTAAVDTSATVVRQDDHANAATVVDRRTVIHQDDAGNIDRKTTVTRQTPEATTTVEQHTITPSPTN